VAKNPTIIISAAAFGLLEYIATRGGLFGLWLGILLLVALGRYCYSILRAAAQGREHLPAVSIESFNPVGDIMVLWHIILFPGLILATAPYQPAGSVVAIIVACVFPASAALMGLTANIAHSLKPTALLGVARTIGSDYLLLVIAYVCIFLGVSVLLTWVVPQLMIVTAIFAFMLETWALLAAFALIGSVIRQHRHDFEIPGEIVPREEEELALRHKGWRRDLDRAYGSMRSGLIASGYDTLHKLVEENEDSLEINHWLIENLFDWEEKKYALEVAAKLVPRLEATGNVTGALELFRRCRYHDTAFSAPRETLDALAAHAEDIGQQGLADELRHASS
jgi:hypothetical protein